MIYEFMATQDLHGWEKPWGPGEMGNLFQLHDRADIKQDAYSNTAPRDMSAPKQWWGITTNNYFNGPNAILEFEIQNETVTIAATGYNVVAMNMPVDSETTYTISGDTSSGGQYAVVYYDADGMYISGEGLKTASFTFTTPENAKHIMVGFRANNSPTPGTISNIQVVLGSSAGDFYPYSNVCMPEGFNIWDPYEAEYFQVYAGYVNANTRELYLRPVYQEYAGEELVGPWMSSLDPYAEDTTPTEGAFVIDFGGELTSFEITPFMLQTLLDSLGIRQHFTDGAGLLNSLMDQAQGRVRSEEELLHLSRPLNVIAIGDQLPAGLTFKPISKDVLPGLPGKFIR